MFRLIKIVNSGVNVPEIIKLPKPASLNVKAGTALTLSGGYVAMCTSTAAPTYIAAENADSSKDSVFCYAVNGNMLFETTFSAKPTSLAIGDKVTLGSDSNSCTVNVTATTTSGVATIVDLMNAANVGDKVTVKF